LKEVCVDLEADILPPPQPIYVCSVFIRHISRIVSGNWMKDAVDIAEDYSELCFVFLFVFVLLLLLVFIILGVAAALTTTSKEQHRLCGPSNVLGYIYAHLGIFGLACCTSANGLIQAGKDNNDSSMTPLAMLLLNVSLSGFAIWGCVEVFSISCFHDLSPHFLYYVAYIYLAVDLVVLFINILLACCGAFSRSI
jgi:hypothetical protein